MKIVQHLLFVGMVSVVQATAACVLCPMLPLADSRFGDTSTESSCDRMVSSCVFDATRYDCQSVEDVQVILYDEITIQIIRPSGSNRLRVGNTGDRIISGPTISGDTCTIVILEKTGRRIMRVYSLPSFSVIRSIVI